MKILETALWWFLHNSKFTKNNLILHLKQVNFKECKLEFNKVDKKD